MSDAMKKVVQARVNLTLEEPFFGTLALRLKVVEDKPSDSPNHTFWTDGTSLGFNPRFVDSLSLDEVVGIVCHEVMHNANGHPWRKDGRDHEDYNIAADYSINPLIVASHKTLPKGALIDPAYQGQSMEEIYSRIHYAPKPQSQEQPQKQQGQGEGEKEDSQGGNCDGLDLPDDDRDGKQEKEKTENEPKDDSNTQGGKDDDGSDGDESESGGFGRQGQGRWAGCGEVREAVGDDTEAQQNDWEVATLQAAQAAKAQGKLPAGIEGLVDEITRTHIDWKSALRRFVQMCASLDYSWQQPSKKYVGSGIYLPSLKSEQMPPVVIYWDTSGSMYDTDSKRKCATEAAAVIEEVSPEITYVIYGDAAVQKVDEFYPGDPIDFHPKGGGGTDFRPIFEWIEREGIQPACFIGLTDLCGSFPDHEPEFPVLWAATENAPAPFGEILRVDQE